MANDEDKDNTNRYIMVFNAIVGGVVLLINAHQSYKARHFTSECMGKELINIDSTKKEFGESSSSSDTESS